VIKEIGETFEDKENWGYHQQNRQMEDWGLEKQERQWEYEAN